MQDNERRTYKRGSHFSCMAVVKDSAKNKFEAEVDDLSSGGLMLVTERSYQVGDILEFDLMVQSFFSEFNLKVKGKVRRIQKEEEMFVYGVAFMGLHHDIKIRIDENVQRDRPHGMDSYTPD